MSTCTPPVGELRLNHILTRQVAHTVGREALMVQVQIALADPQGKQRRTPPTPTTAVIRRARGEDSTAYYARPACV